MATLGQNGKVTLLDIAQSMDPQGKVADVAELLTQTNEILLDMPWFEGNLPTGHQGTIRTGLPTAVWRQFYQGVPPSKSQRAKITDACAMLETRSEVDVDEANLNGNASAFRLSEATASFVEYGWTPTPDPWASLNALFRSYDKAGGGGAFNAGRYSNARLDALIDAIRSEPDLARRRELRMAKEAADATLAAASPAVAETAS